MSGAGIVLLIFAAISFVTGKSLSGGRSDITALIELPFYMAAFGMGLIGLFLVLAGGGQ